MKIRLATPADALGMMEVLNAVIAAGGTTAHETPKTVDDVRLGYVEGPEVLSSVVAEDAGEILGWQSVELWDGDPHIGSFVRPGLQAKGAGSRMFELTCELLRKRRIGHIMAYIRADNAPGLRYYSRIGFRDIGEDPDFALKDGRKVGRIYRRFDL